MFRICKVYFLQISILTSAQYLVYTITSNKAR
nr:MAG TPA: hypothetical protein [Caudoviricetes sp.]